MGAADFPSQENDPACTKPACNIHKICDVMLDRTLGDELSRLAFVRKAQGFTNTSEPQSYLDQLTKNESSTAPAEAWDWERCWMWQTCTEFGYYQTCEVGS